MLNINQNEETSIPVRICKRQNKKSTVDKPGKPRGRPRKKPLDENSEVLKANSSNLKRPRGRPRKKAVVPFGNKDGNDQFVQNLALKYPEVSPELLDTEGGSVHTQKNTVEEKNCKRQKNSTIVGSPAQSIDEIPLRSIVGDIANVGKCSDDTCLPSLLPNNNEGASIEDHQINQCFGQDAAVCINALDSGSKDISLASLSTMKDISLPRVIYCLAHNGRVAWDVKWQPYNENDPKCKQRMGYLAVLLGNGSLEV